jgi:AraC-like DNA-binding protein
MNSNAYPDTIIREGAFVLQPAGSTADFRVHTPIEVIVYFFDHLPTVCSPRFPQESDGREAITSAPVMQTCDAVHFFLKGVKMSLNDGLLCSEYMQSKQTELFYLLNHYYKPEELDDFYAPIYNLHQSFRYFVMNNYHRIKDVEAFARLGEYSVSSFRRLFKETFNEPAYQWILKQKSRDIYNDITTTNMSITEISNKYGFETLSNFSHFCSSKFGKPPRALRGK